MLNIVYGAAKTLVFPPSHAIFFCITEHTMERKMITLVKQIYLADNDMFAEPITADIWLTNRYQ